MFRANLRYYIGGKLLDKIFSPLKTLKTILMIISRYAKKLTRLVKLINKKLH